MPKKDIAKVCPKTFSGNIPCRDHKITLNSVILSPLQGIKNVN